MRKFGVVDAAAENIVTRSMFGVSFPVMHNNTSHDTKHLTHVKEKSPQCY